MDVISTHYDIYCSSTTSDSLSCHLLYLCEDPHNYDFFKLRLNDVYLIGEEVLAIKFRLVIITACVTTMLMCKLLGRVHAANMDRNL